MHVDMRRATPGLHPEVGERRQSSRHAMLCSADVAAWGFPPVVAPVENLSFGGCFVAFRHPLPMGCNVEVRIDLGVSKFAINGTVCRQEHGRGFAIEFCGAN